MGPQMSADRSMACPIEGSEPLHNWVEITKRATTIDPTPIAGARKSNGVTPASMGFSGQAPLSAGIREAGMFASWSLSPLSLLTPTLQT